MATIYIDNKPYQVEEGQNLLHAGLSLGLDIPYFCWHPAMGSVGACRLCAVKQFKDPEDTQGRLVMSCMTPVEEEMRVSLADPEAGAFRRAILEWLMVNHPHDCPICDEGGECHLQDMTVMTGQTYRDYRFKKRTYRNQYLGPLINHEMNRCIQCYRCVRFYNDYAGGGDLQAFAAHDHVYFGRHADGVLESEFSGNLVEVCPTGVFTDKTLKHHYTRKWDLQTAPSICVHCGVGCNTIPGERYGRLRRIRNRYNGQVNHYFLCDRGRYGYEFVNSDQRIRQPLRRQAGVDPTEQQAVSRAEALEQLSSMLPEETALIGIGSPRASLEANFALRSLVAPEQFYAGVSEQEQRLVATILEILQTGPARTPSLRQMGLADAVLVLGEDLTNTAPMIALAVRQAVLQQPRRMAEKIGIHDWQDAAVRELIQHKKGPLFIASPALTKLDQIATQTYRAAPQEIARLGFAVAHQLDPEAPAAPDLPADLQALAGTIARSLKEAERPLIISGTSLGSEAVIQAAANVAWALSDGEKRAELSFTAPESNSLGLGLLGGGHLGEAVQAVEERDGTAVIILENDLYRRAGAATVEKLLDQAGQVIAVDHLLDGTTVKADLVLPAATFAEGDGTLVNNEGRAQRFYQVFEPEGEVQESWRWLRELAAATGRRADELDWQNLDEIVAALAEAEPGFGPISEIAPPAGFRVAGQKLPRQPHRYSGRTAIRANISVHEPKPPPDPDTPLTFTMEGYQGQPPPALVREFWAPGWNSVQAVNKFQSEVGGPLHGGDPGRRLIEPGQVEQVSYYDDIPAPFQPDLDRYLVVPLYHIFGSEELSILTPGLAELAPTSYLGLNPADAARLGLRAEQEAALTFAENLPRLPVKLMPTLPQGVAGIPVGSPGLVGLVLPAWSEVKP